MSTAQSSGRKFRCPACGSASANANRVAKIVGAGNRRRVEGKQRRVTHCRCRKCGHEWWSRQAAALAVAAAEDQKGRERERRVVGGKQGATRAGQGSATDQIDRSEP